LNNCWQQNGNFTDLTGKMTERIYNPCHIAAKRVRGATTGARIAPHDGP